jgi:hypothetical protein
MPRTCSAPTFRGMKTTAQAGWWTGDGQVVRAPYTVGGQAGWYNSNHAGCSPGVPSATRFRGGQPLNRCGGST